MRKNKGKYDLFLTILLIIIFIALVATLGPYIYNIIKSDIAVKEALENFEETTEANNELEINEEKDEVENAKGTLEDILNEINSETDLEEVGDSEANKTSKANQTINYEAVGKIEIPKTGISYPIYDVISKISLESGVSIAYGPGLNQVGNTVIYGHNFRNGKFFSNNKKLTNGNKIYITDLTGNRVEYTIYSVYITTPTDASYMIRDTGGKREISLQTCTDDGSKRLIIWATAD